MALRGLRSSSWRRRKRLVGVAARDMVAWFPSREMKRK
jgi:hypothetical protein